MTKKLRKSPKKSNRRAAPEAEKEVPNGGPENDRPDYGGIPVRDLKKNLGCG